MSQKRYNKLVRDKIPDIIRTRGESCDVVCLNDPHDYSEALRKKLLEEVHEVQRATPSELLGELADVQEVLDTLARSAGISQKTLRKEQMRKRRRSGAFRKRYFLISASDTTISAEIERQPSS